ncbi:MULTISPECIES: hypothetical protein [unclassified Duganella]|uniref:hypothetical protein n=1 Tax=unclassified Duganella TaxID=2636909 RepID=UPI00087F19B4|nr:MULTISPECIES: hypothetical protein [unclassified Duganella]SDG45120.1 hypothetical protein SAMN05216320_104387 [Duganella sp. OV458]SDJ58759.1 hypothetical protein SAMN05428973_10516 [Duganella sp. OV510]
MMLFVLLFLALQLIGVASHNHDYAQHEPDCAACVIADLPVGGVPPMSVSLAPLPPQAALPVLAPITVVHVAQTSYLTPPSHAPPGVAVFS